MREMLFWFKSLGKKYLKELKNIFVFIWVYGFNMYYSNLGKY